MNHPLYAYVPRWVLERLQTARVDPGDVHSMEATVLYGDLAGFTPLTEAMAQRGPQGVEVLTRILDDVFGAIVEAVLAFGGDVARFSGDSVAAFWPLEDERKTRGLQAIAAAQAVQRCMQRFRRVETLWGPTDLEMRLGVGCGPMNLLIVGTAMDRRFVLAGPALDRAAMAEESAPHGQVHLHSSIRHLVGEEVLCDASGCLLTLRTDVSPFPPTPLPAVDPAYLRPFVHPALVERILAGRGEYLADFRHDVAVLFVSFAAGGPAAIQAYTAQVMGIVERHGGSVAIVDAVEKGHVLVSMFGVPLSRGDNCARAAACALDLAALPATLAIGATTGTLFAGVVGSEHRRQYTTFGDEVNLACRLMEVAPEFGERPIILAEATLCRRTGERFNYSEAHQLHIKGKSEPVIARHLLGHLTHRGPRVKRKRRGELVDRQEELAQLEDAIARVKEGTGVVLALSGEAGVGKSCVTDELVRRWNAWRESAYMGAALTSTQYTPYYAWGELLRSFFDLQEDERDVARLEAAIAEVNPDFLPRLPLLSDVMGLGLLDSPLTRHFDAQLRLQSTQALVIDLLRRRASEGPLLLVLEDGHWMDQLSWEMTLVVARATLDLPILLCIVHRPLGEPPPQVYPDLVALDGYIPLELRELPPEEAVALACARLDVDSLPSDLSSLLLEKGHGHPFFTEEILNALGDEGVVRVEGRRVLIQGDLAQVDLPETVQGVVQARIDRLDEGTRLTLKVASVIGRTFPYPVLQGIHPFEPPEARLKQQLEVLEHLDITPLERPVPEPTYIFKHAITHEVTYETLSFSQRRRLHAAVAAWYEQTYAGRPEGLAPYYSLLAYHYAHTGRQDKQVYYLARLARQAHTRYAADAAVSAYERLIEILDGWDAQGEDTQAAHVAEMLALDPQWGKDPLTDRQAPAEPDARIRNAHFGGLLKLEEILSITARRSEQPRVIARLQELAHRSGDPRWLAAAANRQAQFYDLTGGVSETVASATEGLRYAQQAGDVVLQSAHLRTLAGSHWARAEYDVAEHHARSALELSQEAEDVLGAGKSLSMLGIIHIARNQYTGARRCQEEALTLYREVGNLEGVTSCLLNLGIAAIMGGEHEVALTHFEEGLRMTRYMGARRLEGAALQILGEWYKELGLYEQAVSHAQQALAILEGVDDRRRMFHTLHTLADGWLGLGELERAETYARRTIAEGHEAGARFVEGFGLHTLGEALLARGQLKSARRAFEQAAQLREEIEAPGDRTASLAWLGLTELELGDVEAALRYTAQACALFEEVGNAGEYKPQEIMWARYRVLQAAGETEAAAEILAQAHKMVIEHAERLSDPQFRRSYVEHVAVNRAILAAWSA
jgi:class 3 adenylate cyclase/tetratricopeptide (TPR) repeat protein